MITAGIDCGAKHTKTVIMKNGRILGKALTLSGFDLKKAVDECLNRALTEAGVSRDAVQKTIGTGSGKDAIAMADERINEIKAMSRSAVFFFPNARTVADVGAEEGRAAEIDENGIPQDFVINDKCAAGAGTFIETMARALETDLDQVGPMALSSNKEIPMNAQCVIFAESEVIGLIHANIDKQDISKAIHDAMAERITSMMRRIIINEDVVLMGGVGYNMGFVEAMKRDLNLDNIYVPDIPEFGAAVGAALIAAEK